MPSYVDLCWVGGGDDVATADDDDDDDDDEYDANNYDFNNKINDFIDVNTI